MSTWGHQALQLDVIRSRVQAVCVLSHLPAHVPGPKVVLGLGRAVESHLKRFSSLHSASELSIFYSPTCASLASTTLIAFPCRFHTGLSGPDFTQPVATLVSFQYVDKLISDAFTGR